jgi:GTP pyrophosphokinase
VNHETKRVKIDRLSATVAQHYPERAAEGMALIQRALALAQHAPEPSPSALRRGIRAAQMLAALRVDPQAIAATLVAAVMPAAGLPRHALQPALGDDVARLVEGASRLGSVRWTRLQDEAAETLRRMFLAMAQDIRVVLIVLGLRVQSMRAL